MLSLHPCREIVFQGPFDRVVASHLEIYNTSNERLCFKVRTTAPKYYCVKPKDGILNPQTKLTIAIGLQPVENDIQLEQGKHKFKIQSIVVDDDCSNYSDTIWTSTNPKDIMDSATLACVFRAPNLLVDVHEFRF